MKLYLSSYRIGNSGTQLAEWALGKKALIVSNALDFSDDLERLKSGREREMAWLAEFGICSEALDLRDYFGSPDLLSAKVEEAKMLWVVGGNTFLLRKAMKLSKLDKILLDQVDNSDFVYGGYSAGVCVLSKSLKGIHLADEPEAHSIGYEHKTIWSGLGILDYYIVPHYRCDHSESGNMEAVVDYYEKNQLLFETLSDGKVILGDTMTAD